MKDKFPYIEMLGKANYIKSLLEPHCERIEIAGSIRRKCEWIGDIEIVCIPKPYDTGLFESGIATVLERWEIVKGKLDQHCKYTQRLLPDGTKVDLFFAEPGNWGTIFAIRTGSAEYSHLELAVRWNRKGYVSENGYLYKDKEKHECREEEDVFKICGIPYVEPEKRNL